MDSYPIMGVQKVDNYTIDTASSAIYQLWEKVIGDTYLASEFNQAWMLSKFELGDELTKYNCNQHSAVSGGVIYLVCQGKVRLLAFDASLGKEVSIQLLHPNQLFGGDDKFCNQSQEYRAVASSDGIVAQISLQHLDIWLQRYPVLFDYFSQRVQSRQKLIFFKTQTELASIKLPASSNTSVLQKLLPNILSTDISACSLIAELPEGIYWLVNGEIGSISGTSQSPIVGESWGYPNAITSDLISQTDLSLFYLPKEQCDSVAEILPELTSVAVNSREKINNKAEEEDCRVKSEGFQQPSADEGLNQNIQLDNPCSPRKWFGIYPFISQQNSSDCAAACLAMISRYWGKSFSLNTLRSIAHINSIGAEFNDLRNAAETIGYQALGVRGTLNKLESQKLPWIAHYQGNHYIVVWRVKQKSVLISDPAIGKQWVPRSEFEGNFTGYGLLLSPTEIFCLQESEKISWKRFYEFFESYSFLLVKVIIVSIMLTLLGAFLIVVIQIGIDTVITAQHFDSLNIFVLGFLIFGLGRIALTSLRQYLLDYLSNRLDIALTGDLISHILNLPLSFFASRRLGDILSQIQENPKINRFLSRQAISTILDGLMTTIYLGLMAYYSWQLTLIVVSFIALMMCSSALTSKFLKKIGRKYSSDSRMQNSAIVEMISGITTIKTAGAENDLRSHWEKYFTQMMKTRQGGQNLTNSLQLTNNLVNHLGSTTILWYGTQMVVSSQISLGEFIGFNLLIGNAINPMLSLVKLWEDFAEILISVEKLDDFLTTTSEEKAQEALLTLPSIRGEVRFDNVSCHYQGTTNESYSPSQSILHNVSFRVKAGQTIGIIGGSDSGKSTLVNLLAGLCHPDKGRILIDGYDIAQVSASSLRSNLGIVTQEFFLFSGSILENITLYNREFSLEQVKSAAKLAGAHSFIQTLPLGYNTIIGEGGIRLEKLQQQKIALARALIKNPPILIVDELTSSLDSQVEYQFQQNLSRSNHSLLHTSCSSRTIFIVASSLHTIQNTDTILVLDQGILKDQGTHEELIQRSKIYSDLLQQQFKF